MMYNYESNRSEYDRAYRMAERRVKAKMGFYWHLTVYLIINGMFLAIYFLSSLAAGDLYYPWPIWPMAGWGIGLIFNFLAVFVFGEGANSMQQRLLDEEMRKMGTGYTPVDRK